MRNVPCPITPQRAHALAASPEIRPSPVTKFQSVGSFCLILSVLKFTHNSKFKLLVAEPINPCRPSPCGPYSECRVVNQHAVCSCQKNYIGTPPACRPECTVSSECPQDKACMNQRCIDPCPGTCGLNARCNVINHNPICSCSPGFTGDPFIRCLPEESKLILPTFLTPSLAYTISKRIYLSTL